MKSNAAENYQTEGRETYRDEMNFAEFPLALLDRPADGQKTLEFSDTIFDHGQNKPVVRKLTISASDRYGLPTPRDEEVILGLIQLSHKANFADRKVHFTKGSLVKELGWSDDGKSYQRITESLNKWAGITLYWEKSWWSKEEQSWVDETFHIIDNISLYDKERYDRSVKQSGKDRTAGLSSFSWNEVVFSSFKSGYIKKLDFNFYKALDSAISKKMFRFLDKRFHKNKKLEFDLQVFAFEHVGLSRNSPNAEIKRKLRPAILELETKGFLEPIPDEQRFIKQERGVWKVLFIRKGSREAAKPELNQIESELTSRGVTPRVAEELVEKFSEEKILEKIKYHDSLTKQNDKRVSKNSAGFLVTAIKNDFTDPTTIKPIASQAPRPSMINRPAPSIIDEAKKEEARKLNEAYLAWWNSKNQVEQDAIEQKAVTQADKFSARQYESGKEGQGTLFKAARQNILMGYFEKSMLSDLE